MAVIQGRVQRCDNGQGLGNAVITDNVGGVANTDVQGFFSSANAYDGYRIRASFSGMLSKQVTITKAELQAKWVTICLDEDPDYRAPEPIKPSCLITQILGGDVAELWRPSGFLWTLAQFRDRILAASPLGQRAIAAYENEAFAEEVVRLSRSNPEFHASIMRTVLAVYPFVRGLIDGRLGEPESREETVRFTDGMFESITALSSQVRRATGNDELVRTLDEAETELKRFVGLTPREVLDRII